jgi:membrane associated rhomboid family serine protease
MNSLFREADQMLAEHMPIVTRRLFYMVLIGFFLFNALFLVPSVDMLAARLVVLTPNQAILQGHVWQLVTYIAAPVGGIDLSGAISLLFTLIVLFFFGRLVEERMGSDLFLPFIGLCAVLPALLFTVVALATGRGDLPLMGFDYINLAIITVAILWYPTMVVQFFFLPMQMRMLGFIIGLFMLLVMMSYVRALGPVGGMVASSPMLVTPLVAWWLVRKSLLLERMADWNWRNPFRRGPRVAYRKGGGRTGMGHPGRHSDPDDRYNDPHWRLDQ